MANLADLDPSFSVPCRRCAAMLQKGNRFCPFCFEDQLAPADTGDGEPPAVSGRGLSVAKEVPAPMVIDFRDTVQPEADEVIHIPGPTGTAGQEADAEIGMVRPGAFWQTEVLGGGGKSNWLTRFATPQRMVAGIALALVVAGVAVVGLERVYVGGENEATRERAFRDDVERVQGALKRGDLGTAEQVLEGLDADHSDDPAVQALWQAFDKRAQAQAAGGEPLPDVSLKPSRAIRLEQAAAPPAPAPARPEAPLASPPAPTAGAAGPQDKECSEALAALALCSKK
ncbi:hypothetical protein [Variovorax ginsengisoli]|uniref:Zinc ribbon domain-containing protein n=1 Tax=Variovorax ginsengisoli TaxID=363844 RepID=A0ABT8SAB2_9BURK|nr:hypothetical protein [Variovorax ginsengisoli]MDN8616673.1 hypothetical protein [Variovorax ginsengisoli]MDO1535843.1 hypothetical protein [Variovorax ginsengisoli]